MESAKWRLLGVVVLSLCGAVLCIEQKRVKEGADVDFSCNYPASFQNPRIEWKSSSDEGTALIYYNGELTDSYKNRAQFFPQGLRLRSVTRKDTGDYVCEVTGTSSPMYTEIKTGLVVLVPPSTPVAQVPTSVTIGSSTTLRCVENDASPPRTVTWYKNKIPMPEDPKTSPNFQNSTYVINPTTGDLTFYPVTQSDTAEYYCEVTNDQGSKVSAVVTMEAYEKNVGGIVAAVVIVLLIMALIGFALWFAFSRGYIGKKTNKKVIYSQPSDTRSDKNFQQTSSFVV